MCYCPVDGKVFSISAHPEAVEVSFEAVATEVPAEEVEMAGEEAVGEATLAQVGEVEEGLVFLEVEANG